MWEFLRVAWPLLLFVAIPFLIAGSLSLFTLFAARFERLSIPTFVAVEVEEAPSLPAYHVEMDRQAQALGFVPECLTRSIKHHIHASVWISPDHTSILRVGSGKIAGTKYLATTLSSELEDGRIVETRDAATTADLTGMFMIDYLHNADLYELAVRHAKLLEAQESEVIGLLPGDAQIRLDEFDAIRVERLLDLGYAEFADPGQTSWRYTWKGAARMAFKSFFEQRRNLKRAAKRAKVKRPGDRRYKPKYAESSQYAPIPAPIDS